MRNAVTLGVGQNRLNLFRRDFKLLCDFNRTDAIIKVVDNGVDRHPCTAQHRRAALLAALHSSLDFDQRAFRPVNFFHGRHSQLLMNMIPSFHMKSHTAIARDRSRKAPRD